MSSEGIVMTAVLHDYWRSSSAYRVRMALNLCGIVYRTVPVDLTLGEQRFAQNFKINPQGVVPTLEIDGQVLTQSLAIIEYLSEVHGGGFLPVDPLDRARVRAIAHAVAMEIQPVCNLRVARRVVDLTGGAVTMGQWMAPLITEGLTAVEVMLGEGRSGQNQHITLADLCLLPQVYNARRWEVDLTPMPRIRAIADRMEAIPAVAAAHPDRVRPRG
jgi:maleylacetoacetate isomerase